MLGVAYKTLLRTAIIIACANAIKEKTAFGIARACRVVGEAVSSFTGVGNTGGCGCFYGHACRRMVRSLNAAAITQHR